MSSSVLGVIDVGEVMGDCLISSSVLGVIDVGEVMGFWGIVLCLLLSLGLLM